MTETKFDPRQTVRERRVETPEFRVGYGPLMERRRTALDTHCRDRNHLSVPIGGAILQSRAAPPLPAAVKLSLTLVPGFHFTKLTGKVRLQSADQVVMVRQQGQLLAPDLCRLSLSADDSRAGRVESASMAARSR